MSSVLKRTTANVPAFSTAIPNGPTEDGSAGSESEVQRSDARYKAMPMCILRMINTESAGAQDPLGAGAGDWELSDDTENESYIGSPVTVTSGIFSFPSTGKWAIRAYALAVNIAGSYQLNIYSTDDNSTYSQLTTGSVKVITGDTDYLSTNCEVLIKVTDVDLDKIKLTQAVTTSGYFVGDTDKNLTYIVFEKKCDL